MYRTWYEAWLRLTDPGSLQSVLVSRQLYDTTRCLRSLLPVHRGGSIIRVTNLSSSTEVQVKGQNNGEEWHCLAGIHPKGFNIIWIFEYHGRSVRLFPCILFLLSRGGWCVIAKWNFCMSKASDQRALSPLSFPLEWAPPHRDRGCLSSIR